VKEETCLFSGCDVEELKVWPSFNKLSYFIYIRAMKVVQQI
jgi:hypothetical protein